MAELGQRLADTVNTAAVERGLPFHCAQYKGVHLFCTPTPVRDLATAKQSDTAAYARLFHSVLKSGFTLPLRNLRWLHLRRARRSGDRWTGAGGHRRLGVLKEKEVAMSSMVQIKQADDAGGVAPAS